MQSSRPENQTTENGNQISDEEKQRILEQLKMEEEEIEAEYQRQLAKITDDNNYLLPINNLTIIKTKLEGLKQHYRNFSYDSKEKVYKFLDEHKDIYNVDHEITNTFKRFVQATELVNLKISKLEQDLKAYSVFVNYNNLVQKFDEFSTRIIKLASGLADLNKVRQQQDIAYKNYQACFPLVDTMLEKLDKVEHDLLQISIRANIDLLIDMQRKTEHSFEVMKAKQSETPDNNRMMQIYFVEQKQKISTLDQKVRMEGMKFKNFVNALKERKNQNNNSNSSIEKSTAIKGRQQFGHFPSNSNVPLNPNSSTDTLITITNKR